MAIIPKFTDHDNKPKPKGKVKPAKVTLTVLPPDDPKPCQWVTKFCRNSFIKPMSTKELALPRQILDDHVVSQNSWGSVVYSGPQLSQVEQAMLLALINFLQNDRRHVQYIGTKPTWFYDGPLLPILKLLGRENRNPSANDYKRAIDCIAMLSKANVSITTGKGTDCEERNFGNIISDGKWNSKTKRVQIIFSTFFYESYKASGHTAINLAEWSRLASPIAKALYCFLESQERPHWSGRYDVMAGILNIDMGQPPNKIKKLIQGAIDELLAKGYFKAEGTHRKGDVFNMCRSPKKAKSKTTILKNYNDLQRDRDMRIAMIEAEAAF